MQQDGAQVVGLKVLAWLAGQDDLFITFMGATGAQADDLKMNAQTPEFLVSVLDFVLQDDAWVLAAADAVGQLPQDIGMARAILGGRDRMHWT